MNLVALTDDLQFDHGRRDTYPCVTPRPPVVRARLKPVQSVYPQF